MCTLLPHQQFTGASEGSRPKPASAGSIAIAARPRGSPPAHEAAAWQACLAACLSQMWQCSQRMPCGQRCCQRSAGCPALRDCEGFVTSHQCRWQRRATTGEPAAPGRLRLHARHPPLPQVRRWPRHAPGHPVSPAQIEGAHCQVVQTLFASLGLLGRRRRSQCESGTAQKLPTLCCAVVAGAPAPAGSLLCRLPCLPSVGHAQRPAPRRRTSSRCCARSSWRPSSWQNASRAECSAAPAGCESTKAQQPAPWLPPRHSGRRSSVPAARLAAASCPSRPGSASAMAKSRPASSRRMCSLMLSRLGTAKRTASEVAAGSSAPRATSCAAAASARASWSCGSGSSAESSRQSTALSSCSRAGEGGS